MRDDPQLHETPGLSAGAQDRFRVTYRIAAASAREAEALAREIAVEQTVEIPPDCIPAAILAAGIVGDVETLAPAASAWDAKISYRADLAGDAIPNFLNVLYGNSSLRRGVRIVSLAPTAAQCAALGGPQVGVEGLRAMLGAHGRALAMTAIKPVGLSARELARFAGGYAAGGLDIVKDDHGLIDQRFAPFQERVARCQEAVTAANARTGGKTLYFPMISGGYDALAEQFAYAAAQGVRGVMTAPMLIGPDSARALARRHGLALMAHPAFTGTHFSDPAHGMTPAALLGTLFRLFGADISIFPNAGGRFGFTPAECAETADALRTPLRALRPAFPSPAGGMSIARVPDMIAAFGQDTALLIGGALMQHSPDPETGAAAFRDAVEKAAKGGVA